MYMVNRNRKRIDEYFTLEAECGRKLPCASIDNPGLRPVIIVNIKDI